jgi:EAL domain-containing protein (putative c-di-GMP-specific phosphodiesterase class I)
MTSKARIPADYRFRTPKDHRAVELRQLQRAAGAEDMRLANDLHRALGRGELRLVYQPIIDLGDRQVSGVEALVRWERPGIGLVAPADFMEVAESTGHVVALGAWVAQESCRAAVTLSRSSDRPIIMSINLSARQLMDQGVVDMLDHALRDSGCPASNVIVEVTETALMHDMGEAIVMLEAIKALGVSLALDDFGTGYSSLLYLKHFPVDRIKIDRSFLEGLGIDSADTAIVTSTIALAHSVGLQCIAEGVESKKQLELLREMDCDAAQGYLISRPMTLDQLQEWLPRYRPVGESERSRSRRPRSLPPEAAQIMCQHAAGASLLTNAAMLNRRGLRTAKGTRWTADSVANVIVRSQRAQLASTP